MRPSPAAPNDTLGQLLARHARATPSATALRFEGQAWTWSDLDQQSRALAGRLGDGGVRRGDRVAWLGLNHPAQLLLLLALARLQAVLLPLNYRLSPAEWDAILGECRPRQLFHDAAWCEAAQALAARHGIQAQGCEALLEAVAGQHDPAPEARDEAAKGKSEGEGEGVGQDLAVPLLLVNTSGTSGRARTAVHTQAGLLANMVSAAAVQRITPQDRVLTVLPLFHVGGLCIQTLPAWHAGACVLLQGRFDAGRTLDAIAGQRPTLTLQVPATMKALIEHPRWAATDLSSLRALWAGSSLLPAPLVSAFHARGIPVCNVYGATETGPFSIALPPEHAQDHLGSCGWPAPGVEIRLAPLETGNIGSAAMDAGELLIRGPAVVQRYWPDQPACDGEGWFHSGDLATRAADGSYTVVGRARELIISGGENIHPAEIEVPLAEHPAVAECAAFALPDARWGEVVVVAVVLRPGATTSGAELQAHLAPRLARYKLPRRWLQVDALPRTALGKLQRHQLAGLVSTAALL